MEPLEKELAILFADICDSTPLYEKSGATVALALIAGCLDELALRAREHGGTVIRSKGDDVLCTFTDPASALDAAAAMVGIRGPDTTEIHIGLHLGPAIAARQDIYGDAVNVAARMLALAKPGEIVASDALFDALPADRQEGLMSLGRRTLKGKQMPMEVYSMVLDEGSTTLGVWGHPARVADAPPETVVADVVVDLEHNRQQFTVREGERFVLGRAQRCNLVLWELCVSREHAWVEVRGGRGILTDRSSTGSWILDGKGEHISLRRESAALRGHGRMRLGLHPREKQLAPEISFHVRQIV